MAAGHRRAGHGPHAAAIEAIQTQPSSTCRRICCRPEHFALKCGDSMIEAGILDGDIA
jgi:SOS-response transcriptional repressor LexA